MRLSIFTGLCVGVLLFLLFLYLNRFIITRGIIKYTLFGIVFSVGLIESVMYLYSIFNKKEINWDVPLTRKDMG